MLINNLNLDFNLLICVFIILSILLLNKIKIVNNYLKIIFLLFVIVSCQYDKRITILFFIMYILITSYKNENIWGLTARVLVTISAGLNLRGYPPCDDI